MKEININNNPVYLYLAKTLEFAKLLRSTSYTRETPILFCTDKEGYYLGIQYDHNHIGSVSNDRYSNKHDVDLLIKCADKEYNIDDYIGGYNINMRRVQIYQNYDKAEKHPGFTTKRLEI